MEEEQVVRRGCFCWGNPEIKAVRPLLFDLFNRILEGLLFGLRPNLNPPFSLCVHDNLPNHSNNREFATITGV
jgi:hypothetical protein